MDKKQDVANEPVDVDEDEFMDTGVLHEKKKKDDESDEEDQDEQ